MTTFDFSPLYRSSVGFDRLATLFDNAMQQNQSSGGYPPYNIESAEENHYAITLAVAGFAREELNIEVEQGVLTITGKKAKSEDDQTRYLHQGIATRSFERKFQLADHVEVVNADMQNGLLTVSLVKEIPEAAKPKQIAINGESPQAIEHNQAA